MMVGARRGCSRGSLLALLLAGSIQATLTGAATAQDSARPTSLEIVPQSAAWYWASINHQAQRAAVVESRAWQQLMDTRKKLT